MERQIAQWKEDGGGWKKKYENEARLRIEVNNRPLEIGKTTWGIKLYHVAKTRGLEIELHVAFC